MWLIFHSYPVDINVCNLESICIHESNMWTGRKIWPLGGRGSRNKHYLMASQLWFNFLRKNQHQIQQFLLENTNDRVITIASNFRQLHKMLPNLAIKSVAIHVAKWWWLNNLAKFSFKSIIFSCLSLKQFNVNSAH